MALGSDDNYFIVNGNGHKLYCKQWASKGEPRAIVFISHGFAEHCQYYSILACALAEIGCFVYAHDHVGHGRSEGPKVQIDDVNTYIRDVFHHTDLIKEKHSGLPFYYIGHSMGSMIGILAAMKKPNYFKGVILLGVPVAVSNRVVNPSTSKFCQALGWMFPNFPLFPLDYSLPTRDPGITQIRIKDPLSWHGFARAGWCRALLKGMEDIENNVKVFDGPLLLMHGDRDKICSIEGAKILYRNCSSVDKTLKIYVNSYHNILDEPEGIKEQALEDIILWLKDRFN